MKRLISSLLRETRPSTTDELIAYLFDRERRIDIRDDIAMDLSASDDPKAERALLTIVLNHDEDEMLIDSAGDSLREIWLRRGKRDDELIGLMHPSARKFFE